MQLDGLMLMHGGNERLKHSLNMVVYDSRLTAVGVIGVLLAPVALFQ